MTPTDPLAQLRDIHLPEPVSWWPPAPGWWLLAVLSIALCTGLAIWVRKYWRRTGYRRRAREELLNLFSKAQSTGDPGVYLHGANHIVKRAALAGFPRDQVAALSGTAWLTFLKSGGLQLDDAASELLITAPYQPSIDCDPATLEHLHQQLLHWLRKHSCSS